MMRFFRGQDVLCLSLLVIVVVEFVSGQPTGSKLIIKCPERLVAELDHRDSDFGEYPYPYGPTIAQQVYYANDDLCERRLTSSEMRSLFLSEEVVASKDETGPGYDASQWESPFILLIDRGGCTFVKKIRNAQRLGASAVIIADNVCQCSDANCDSGGGTCESEEPTMVDDGSGGNIKIPSMLIFKTDADRLIQELKNNTKIVMVMSYNPTPSDEAIGMNDCVQEEESTTPTLDEELQQKEEESVSGMNDSVQEEESTALNLDEGLQQEEEKEVLDREKVEQESISLIEEETTTSESTPCSGFFSGVITGAVGTVALVVSAALLVRFKKKSNTRTREHYMAIELTS